MVNEFKSFFKDVGGNEGSKCKYPVRLDTYGKGCAHDCKYCYAKSLLDFRKLWNPLAPAVANPEKIRNILDKVAEGKISLCSAVRLGGMTDCFQPCERDNKVTYATIQMLNQRRIPYLIVTKSDLVATDEYMAVLDKDLAHIQITVTTTDDNLSLNYEKAVVPSRRIAAIEKLQSAGFDVALRLSPFIPEFIDYEKLNAVKCDKIVVEFLRVNSWIRKWFGDMVDFSDYIVKQSGYCHLPLEIKQELIKNIHFKQVTVCEDESRAYEYWKSNFNPNPEDCCNLRKSRP
jgi:DNA repair photolyase